MKYNSATLPAEVRSKLPPDDPSYLKPIAQIEAEATATNEKALQRQICAYLRQEPWCVRKIGCSAMHKRTTRTVGEVDIEFVWNRIPIGLEAKMPGNDPTEEQDRIMADMIADGWTVRVVRSLSEVQTLMRSLPPASVAIHAK